MDVIDLLLPEPLGNNPFGMLCGLPEASLTIFARRTAKRLAKHGRKMSVAVIRQFSPSEFSEIIQRMLQPIAIEIPVEYNCMYMIGHDDICVDAQAFILDAEIQAAGDNFASGFFDKDRKPFNHRECHKVDADAFQNSITFHS